MKNYKMKYIFNSHIIYSHLNNKTKIFSITTVFLNIKKNKLVNKKNNFLAK